MSVLPTTKSLNLLVCLCLFSSDICGCSDGMRMQNELCKFDITRTTMPHANSLVFCTLCAYHVCNEILLYTLVHWSDRKISAALCFAMLLHPHPCCWGRPDVNSTPPGFTSWLGVYCLVQARSPGFRHRIQRRCVSVMHCALCTKLHPPSIE